MMLNKKTKDKIIKKFAVHEGDTGGSEVQIAILTKEIEELTKHLKENKHDFSSRYGLFKKIGQRRNLLKYLQRENLKSFTKLTTDLKI
ncbi:MAG: 30S ribosomal protein S15 [Candidatus Kuenenbacteria bacterium]